MRHAIALLLLLALAVVARAATTTGTTMSILGLRSITLSVDAATTVDVVATDTGELSSSKRAQITRRVAGGQTQYVLTRVQVSSNGVFVDEVAAVTTTALATRIAAFDFTTSSPGHPSPTHDAVDDAVSALMVGYTGS
jgi:hypothetical protein